MGRRPRRQRRHRLTALLGVAAGALCLAAAGSGAPVIHGALTAPVGSAGPAGSVRPVGTVSAANPAGRTVAIGDRAGQAELQVVAGRASRTAWRVVDAALPVGVAPEEGLQVRTILVARSISAEFPQIMEIGGVRPDSMRWHPDGLAVDIMIPDPGSAEGIELGDRIVAYALANAGRFGLQDVIWRGVYYTPGGPGGSGNGHFDHVHITTTGGGYPTGHEVYIR